MIIFNDEKKIYVHIPKNGGTSITKLLEPYLKWNDILLGGTAVGELFQDVWAPRFGLYKHSAPYEIKDVIGELVYGDYTKFITTRHPLSRFKSAYSFLKTAALNEAKWYLNSKEYGMAINLNSPEEFIDSDFYRNIFHPSDNGYTDIEKLFIPQSYFFNQSEFKENKFLYFKLENLVNDSSPLLSFLNISGEMEIPWANKTNAENSFFGGDLCERLARIYEVDFTVFNYDIL